MANLDFYALESDQHDLLAFLYAETDITVFELASEYDCEARQFKSLSELGKAFTLGQHPAVHFQLWSPSVMAAPIIRRIDLKVPNHSYRYAVEGLGLIQLYLDGQQDESIYHTHYGHWNEAGARARSAYSPNTCDWKALAKLSGRIQRHIRSRLSVATLFGRPILSQAFSAVQHGAGLIFNGISHRSDSTAIENIADAPP
jgi:hypothetical protein